MDRNREARRSTMAATNGLTRRRHRTTEEDVAAESPETARLRDRGNGKKDRDSERDRVAPSKRRRAERLMHGESNREDAGEESSGESVNDEEDDENEDSGGSNYRKVFPPAKIYRTAATWKPADEMIGVSVPRKARSVSTKRAHDSWTPTAVVGGSELIHRHTSTSPARLTVGLSTASPAPASPSSSDAAARKKLKGPKLRPPKVSSKSSPAQDEIEIEIAEVLYGMMRQPQGPSKQEISISDSREVNKSTTDAKSRVSSPILNSALQIQPSIVTQNSASIITSMSAIAPKRKKPRPIKYEDEIPSSFSGRNGAIFASTKPETDDHSAITEISSHKLKKSSGLLAENGRISVNSFASASLEPIEHIKPEVNGFSDSKSLVEETNGEDLGMTNEEPQSPKNGAPVLNNNLDRMTYSSMAEFENQREEKIQIDLMAPPSRSSSDRNGEIDFVAVDPTSMVTDAEPEINKPKEEDEVNVEAKAEPESGYGGSSNNKLNRHGKKQHQSSSISDKSGQANTLPLPMAVAGWPPPLPPPMAYVTPLQGVVSMDGSSVTSSAAIQAQNLLFAPERPKRCATHCYIARNICYHQQMARLNSYWPAVPGSVSMFGAKHCSLNVLPSSDFPGNLPGKSPSSMPDKAQCLLGFSGKDNKSAQSTSIVDVSQRKQILVQQSLPPGAPTNILGPAFIFPLNQQQAVAATGRPGSVKSPSGGPVSSATSGSASTSGSVGAAIAGPTMSFNYPNMPLNEAQYLAFLQNNGYSFPIPSHVGALPGYGGAPAFPFFNSSFYSSQKIHPHGQSQPSQQGPQSTAVAGVYGGGNLPGKNQASQPLQTTRPQPLESEIVVEESASAADRVSRSNMNVYYQNFPMPIRKKHSQSQISSKTGLEPAQAFALSFPAVNGASTTSGIDLSTIAPNHPMSQNLAELSRQSYQFMAAQATQPKKSYPDRNGDNSSSMEEDRKTIAFSRTDLLDESSCVLTIPGPTTMVDVSAQRPSGSIISPPRASISQHQMQRNQQQFAAAARSKAPPAASNASAGVYSDHFSSSPSTMAAKFQAPIRSVSSSTPASTKSIPQQPNRDLQSHTQISFASSPKSSLQNQAQQAASVSCSQAPSPPLMAASPTSKTSTPSQGTKTGQAPIPTQNSIVGNPHGTSSSSSGGKTRQQHLSKQPLQQAQLFFSHPSYMQAQASHSGGGLPTPTVLHSSGFPYIRAISPAEIQVKPTEKQSAGE